MTSFFHTPDYSRKETEDKRKRKGKINKNLAMLAIL